MFCVRLCGTSGVRSSELSLLGHENQTAQTKESRRRRRKTSQSRPFVFKPLLIFDSIFQNEFELIGPDADRASPLFGVSSATLVNRRRTTSVDDYRVSQSSSHAVTTQPPRFRSLVKGNPALCVKSFNRRPRQRRVRQFLNYLRTHTRSIRHRLPHIRDVNDIDKWSRLLFPLLFMLFNAAYWPYYMARPQEFT